MTSGMSKLTPKQARFVEEYLIDLNASAAARRAGYSVRTAEWQGPQLLGKTHVAATIAAAQQKRSERTQIDSDWVLRRLHGEAEADMADLYDDEGRLLPVNKWPMVFRKGLVVGMDIATEYDGKGDSATITTVRKVRLQDRTKTVELIGRHVHVGAFRDRVEHGGPHGGPIPLAAVSMTPDEFRVMAMEMAKSV